MLNTELILLMVIIFARGEEIEQTKTHYDYSQGIGRITENNHYLHFHINLTTLKNTYNQILTSYTILSFRRELNESNLLQRAAILCKEIKENLQQIIPQEKRMKRGLFDGLGTVIKYVFGNPDANDLKGISSYLDLLDHQQQENIVTLNNSISIINKISNDISSNTEIINKNLFNISKALSDEYTKINLFEMIVTLMMEEQHFLNLLGKIKRSFIFSGQLFDLEILTGEQISEIHTHLLKSYSRKELMLNYRDLLEFRFAQGSIVLSHDYIIYTLKIPILNPIEFSLIQRLAIINNSNQTEITNIPWTLIGPSIKLFANKCQLIQEKNYLCYQIMTEVGNPIIISMTFPMILTYKLSENLTLVSSNYPITIKYDTSERTIRGTYQIQGSNIKIQGHTIDDYLGEIKQSTLIIPLIIKDHRLNFEPLKMLTIPTLSMPIHQPLKIEFFTSISSIMLVLLFLLITSICLIYKYKNKKQSPTKIVKNEDVLEFGQGGVI